MYSKAMRFQLVAAARTSRWAEVTVAPRGIATPAKRAAAMLPVAASLPIHIVLSDCRAPDTSLASLSPLPTASVRVTGPPPPPLSSSTIDTVADPSAMVAFTGALSCTPNVSVVSTRASATIGTAMVWVVTPGAKVSVPERTAKSPGAAAVPLAVA